MKKILGVVVFLGFFLLPNVYWNGNNVAFEIPKVIFLYVWTAVVFGLSVGFVFGGGKLNKLEKIHGMAILLLMSGVLSGVLGVDTGKSILGNYYRWDGIITMMVLISMFINFSLLPKDVWEKPSRKGIVCGSILAAYMVWVQYFWDLGVGFEGYGAGFGQPVFLAGYLLVSAPIVWMETRNWWTTGIVLLAILPTNSLFSVLGILAVVLGLLYVEKKLNLKVLGFATLLLALLLTRMYLSEIGQQTVRGGVAYESRERIWVKSWMAFRQKPLLGWGPANFDAAFDSVDWPIKLQNDVYVDKAHSVLVETAVTQGTIGLLFYVIFIGLVWVRLRARQNNDQGLLVLCCLFYLIHSQTNVISVAEETLLWWLAAEAVVG